MTSTTGRKIGLILALLIPALLFVLQAALGQPGRPGPPRPPIPFPQPPPPQPPSQPPQPPFQPPQPPFQPPVHQPPVIPPIQPPVIPPIQAPVWITVWSCSRCQAELGRGDIKPAIAVCPRCGAH